MLQAVVNGSGEADVRKAGRQLPVSLHNKTEEDDLREWR